ncbi:MAG: YbaB/EbfC family nucleoid-associated protein [Gammaproteobacteria bacterium]|nr:YbaB/EbfC family nucleoid-associated protein [Gammaproteobacteria bacterium]
MRGGIGDLMKQAQQMQANLQKAQQEIANIEVTGNAGGNMVSIVMTGKHDVKRVTIDPNLMKEDKEMLEDLIAAAFNDAVRQLEQTTQSKMSALTSGMNLPPGFKLPF